MGLDQSFYTKLTDESEQEQYEVAYFRKFTALHTEINDLKPVKSGDYVELNKRDLNKIKEWLLDNIYSYYMNDEGEISSEFYRLIGALTIHDKLYYYADW